MPMLMIFITIIDSIYSEGLRRIIKDLDNSPRGRINPGPLLGGVIIAQGAGLIPAPYWVE